MALTALFFFLLRMMSLPRLESMIHCDFEAEGRRNR